MTLRSVNLLVWQKVTDKTVVQLVKAVSGGDNSSKSLLEIRGSLLIRDPNMRKEEL